jgi:flagellar biosynthesis protein FliQ
MNEVDGLKLVQEALWTVVVVSGPPVGAAMLIGVAIALLQALTQVQEATLTFVPKILAIFAMMVMLAPLLASQLMGFTQEAYAHIATGF